MDFLKCYIETNVHCFFRKKSEGKINGLYDKLSTVTIRI